MSWVTFQELMRLKQIFESALNMLRERDFIPGCGYSGMKMHNQPGDWNGDNGCVERRQSSIFCEFASMQKYTNIDKY